MKAAYVKTARIAKKVAGACGILSILEQSKSRRALWFRSLFGIYDSADLVHLGLPWWTFSAIDAVDIFLTSKRGGARVFEYGAGASTVWLARRSAFVYSVEHDAPFAKSMATIFGAHDNVEVSIVEPQRANTASRALSSRKGYRESAFDDYVASIDKIGGEFDLIVIDGRARVACLHKAMPHLAPGGAILFDNSDRGEYRAAIEKCGLTERRLRGMAPSLPFPSQTSLLTEVS